METQPFIPTFRLETESAPFPSVDRLPLKHATRRPPRPILPATHVRSIVVAENDLRNQIGFQNDLNTLLAAMDMGGSPFGCAAPLLSRQWNLAPVIETDLSEIETNPLLEAVQWSRQRKSRSGG
ncbi:MAG: hypothetical protein SGI86_10535 [Deltaproteobacteria bacterium]|nr:hypothetical protein [Deltaproteobacteria bacterium]